MKLSERMREIANSYKDSASIWDEGKPAMWASFADEVAQLEEKLAAFRTEAAQLGVDYAKLEAINDELNEEIVRMNKEFTPLEAETAALKRENKVLRERIKALEANTSKSVLRRLEIQLTGEQDDETE